MNNLNLIARGIRGAGGGGSGKGGKEQREPVEAPDSLRSIAYAQVLDLISEGECFGWADPVNPFRCYFLNETPLENVDGSRNFKNVLVDYRFGTQSQDYIRGMDSAVNEFAAGVVLPFATPWTHAFTNLSLSAVRVRLGIPYLTKTHTKTGDINGHRVEYKIELATDGGSFVEVHRNAFDGKTTTGYERSHRVNLPPAVTSGWILRVSRVTPDPSTVTISDEISVVSYAEMIDAKLRFPMSAIVATVVDASQFNSIPSRAFHWKGRILKVPSNYDPETAIYTGVWDGTFQSQYSNNPAWVWYDMAINNRYGLGKLLTAAQLDKWALYEIAQYCDGLVNDGKGGTERRFTCNMYLQSRQDALRVMQALATCFRGITYASGGQIVAVADMPQDPVYTYTRANVIDGKFIYSGSSRKVRHTVALVSWNDMRDFGRAKVEPYEDEEGIARYGIQPTEVIAMGCTSQGQARRMGKYIVTTERYETDAVAFSVGLDGTFVAPGKIIRIADPLRANRRIGGRIKTYTVVGLGAEIEVDQADLIVAGNDIVCILPTGLPEVREIASVAGNIVSIAAAFSAAPIPQSVWAVEADDLATQRFRVLGVSQRPAGEGLGFTFDAIQHVEGKFDFVEDGTIIVEPPISSGTVIQPPSVMWMSNFERIVSNLPVVVMVVQWLPVEGATMYEVSYQREGGNWTAPVRVDTVRMEVEGATPGMYRCKICSIDSRGFTSTPGISVFEEIGGPTFTVVTDLWIGPGGQLIIQCNLGEQFRLLLTENVTEVFFWNVLLETTIIIEIQQTGDFTIVWPANVVPVSGVPYVVTQGGDPDALKIDTVGLHTDTGGVTWQLRADLDDDPSSGGGGGPLTVAITPNPAYAYAGAAPDVDVLATVTGGTAPITVLWSRGAGGIGDWSGSSGNTGGPNFTCSDPTDLNPNFSRTGTADGYVAQNWRVVATDATGLQAQTIAEITLEDDGVMPGGGGGVTCVWGSAWMPDGRMAFEVKVGSRVLGVDPLTMEKKQLLVSYSKRAMAECYLLRCVNGVELTCSDTAPIPTRDGTLVLAPDMLGKETITMGAGMPVEWSEVSEVVYVGRLPVQHITAENGCFYAGNIKGRYMAHHNIKWPPSQLE